MARGAIEKRLNRLEAALSAEPNTAPAKILLFEQMSGDPESFSLTSKGALGLQGDKTIFTDVEISELAKAGRRCVCVMKDFGDDSA